MHDFRRPNKGNMLRWKGAVWVIKQNRNGVLLLEIAASGELERLTMTALQQGIYDGGIAMVRDAAADLPENKQALAKLTVEGLPLSMQAVVKRKRIYIEAFLDPAGFYEKHLPGTPVGRRHTPRTRSAAKVVPLLRDVADTMKPRDAVPSFTAFNGWLKDWQQYQDWRLMAPRYDRRGPDERTVIVGKVKDAVDAAIDEIWMKPNGFTKIDVCEEVERVLQLLNRKTSADGHLTVSRRQIYRYMDDSIDKYDEAVARSGKVAADRKFKPVNHGPESFRVLDIVEVDHTQAKLEVYDDVTGQSLGRPWVTAAIDRCSRMVVGLHIHFEGQTTHASMQALKNSMRPKGFLRILLEDMNYDYPCCGNPFNFFFDQGSDFISDHMIGVGLNCDIKLDYAPGENPQYKAKIERFFRTFHEATAARMKGAMPRIRVDGDRRPTKSEASISYSDFYERVWRFVALDYSLSHHDGIGCSPLERWNERVEIDQPREPIRKEKLDEYLMLAVMGTPGRNGIEYEGLIWQGHVLKKITTHPSFKDGKRITLRIDEADVANAFVTDPVSGLLVRLEPYLKEYMTGTSMFVHRRVRDNVEKKKRGTQSQLELLQTKARLRKQALESHHNKNTPSKTRARIARLSGIGEIAPSDDDLGSLDPGRPTSASGDTGQAKPVEASKPGRGTLPVTAAPQLPETGKPALAPVTRKTAFRELPDADDN